MRADGYLFMLDRETGKPFTKVEERPCRRMPHRRPRRRSRSRSAPIACSMTATHGRSSTTPKGFEIGCFFTPAVGPETERPRAELRHARRADVVQPADRLLLRDRRGRPELAAARRRSALLQQLVQQHACPASTPSNYGVVAAIDSRTNKVVVEEGIPAGTSERRDDDGRRPAVPGVRRREPRGTRRQEPATALWQFQTGAAGGPTDDVRDRRRAVHRDDLRERPSGRSSSEARCRRPRRSRQPDAGGVRRPDHRHQSDRNRVARARQRVHRLPLFHGRVRVRAVSRAR